MGASAWESLLGVPYLSAGTAGTANTAAGSPIPAGAIIVAIFATAATGTAGSMQMFAQPAVTIPAGTFLELDFKHANWVVQGPNNIAAGQIVFTNTASFVVHYVQPLG